MEVSPLSACSQSAIEAEKVRESPLPVKRQSPNPRDSPLIVLSGETIPRGTTRPYGSPSPCSLGPISTQGLVCTDEFVACKGRYEG